MVINESFWDDSTDIEKVNDQIVDSDGDEYLRQNAQWTILFPTTINDMDDYHYKTFNDSSENHMEYQRQLERVERKFDVLCEGCGAEILGFRYHLYGQSDVVNDTCSEIVGFGDKKMFVANDNYNEHTAKVVRMYVYITFGREPKPQDALRFMLNFQSMDKVLTSPKFNMIRSCGSYYATFDLQKRMYNCYVDYKLGAADIVQTYNIRQDVPDISDLFLDGLSERVYAFNLFDKCKVISPEMKYSDLLYAMYDNNDGNRFVKTFDSDAWFLLGHFDGFCEKDVERVAEVFGKFKRYETRRHLNKREEYWINRLNERSNQKAIEAHSGILKDAPFNAYMRGDNEHWNVFIVYDGTFEMDGVEYVVSCECVHYKSSFGKDRIYKMSREDFQTQLRSQYCGPFAAIRLLAESDDSAYDLFIKSIDNRQ